jgi:hypothetical protein
MWNACSDVLDECGIKDIEEYLEFQTPKNEVVEQVRAALATKIQDLAVVDSEAIHFSLISLAQMATRVNAHAKITREGIKEIASLIVQGHLHSHLIKGPEAEEIIEINDKWATWEKFAGKTFVL